MLEFALLGLTLAKSSKVTPGTEMQSILLFATNLPLVVENASIRWCINFAKNIEISKFFLSKYVFCLALLALKCDNQNIAWHLHESVGALYENPYVYVALDGRERGSCWITPRGLPGSPGTWKRKWSMAHGTSWHNCSYCIMAFVAAKVVPPRGVLLRSWLEPEDHQIVRNQACWYTYCHTVFVKRAKVFKALKFLSCQFSP